MPLCICDVRLENLFSKKLQHRPFRIFLKDMSKSTHAGTRKSANYGWLG